MLEYIISLTILLSVAVLGLNLGEDLACDSQQVASRFKAITYRLHQNSRSSWATSGCRQSGGLHLELNGQLGRTR
jgi:hypothetical protein